MKRLSRHTALRLLLTALAAGALLVLIAGCGSQTKTLKDADNGASVTLGTGGELVVKLEITAGTGYAWQVVDDVGGALELQGEPTTEQGSDANVVGGVETQAFTFKAVKAGSGTLALEYKRSWETTVPAEKTWSAEVTVK